MKNEKIISIIGITWFLLWASYIPQLVVYYPFQELKGVKSLIDEVSHAPDFIKRESGLLDKDPKKLEESLMREIRYVWVKSVFIVFGGLFTAVLLLKKKRSGRILALTIAGVLSFSEIIIFFKYWHYTMSAEYWEVKFKYFPMRTVQNIFAGIILMMTIILLFRPSLAAQFRKRKDET